MSILKKYVLNRARPEGSIAKGYGFEEVIEFCIDFVDSIDSIGLPVSRYEGRLQGKGTIGRKSSLSNNTDLFIKAHLTVLQQSSMVTPYRTEHEQIIDSQIGNSGATVAGRRAMLSFFLLTIRSLPWV